MAQATFANPWHDEIGRFAPKGTGTRLPDVPFSEVRIAYRPRHPDGHADPGEIVWADVPFVEDPSRSKDRPVLVIGRTIDGKNLVGLQLTSQGGRGCPSIGSGDWDRSGRESYLDMKRFIQIDEHNYRREGAYMRKPKFESIVNELSRQQGKPPPELTIEFANPWHDEIGRFAPKGVGTRTPGQFYPAADYPALTSEDEVYEATTLWASPASLGGPVFDDRGELPYVAMTEAANRAARGLPIRASNAAEAGIGLLKGMPDAPRTEVPHYRALTRAFDPERGIDALTSATPELELAISEYLPGRGRGALIRFEPGTPYREALGGSWGQIEESIVSGRFEFTRATDLTEAEEILTYDLNSGDQTPVWSARWVGHVEIPVDRDEYTNHHHASQFANPWHDEIGRFAPKGTGSKSPDIPGLVKFQSGENQAYADPDFKGPGNRWAEVLDNEVILFGHDRPAHIDGPEPEGREISHADHDGTPEGVAAAVAGLLDKPVRMEGTSYITRDWGERAPGVHRLDAIDGWRSAYDREAMTPEMQEKYDEKFDSPYAWERHVNSYLPGVKNSGKVVSGKAKSLADAQTKAMNAQQKEIDAATIKSQERDRRLRDEGRLTIGEFANPWHDEIGRFAPKGTGRQFGASQGEMRALFDPVRPLVDVLEGAGAKTYLVGGSVRDRLLGIDAKDIDIEVHGMTPEETIELLKEQGARVDEVGASFGVLKVTFDGETHDFSFPRTEVKTGEGHTGFDVTVDPNLGIDKALERRDFTMNALAVDSDGNLIDPFGGVADLKAGVLRHVGPAFSEDPLRILRGVQFASRLDLTFDPETAQLARDLLPELEAMHSDRVWGEFQKLGEKGTSMEAGVLALRDVGLDTRYGNIGFDGEPDLAGLTGDQRAAVALASIGIDPQAIGAPRPVARAMSDIDKALAFTGDGAASRTLARELKYGTFEDAARIAGPNTNVDPRVLTGPLPSLVTGDDVMARGIRGPAVGEVLRAVQRAQDSETIVTRADALEWLDRHAETSNRRSAEFVNPWHDEIGRFAPKGTGRNVAIETWGTDRPVTVKKSERSSRTSHSVTTANGDEIILHDIDNRLSEQTISDFLNGVADAHDLSPGMKVPSIWVKDAPQFARDFAALNMAVSYEEALEAFEDAAAFVMTSEPEMIFINPEHIDTDFSGVGMPVTNQISSARYAAMHEYGHLRIGQGIDKRTKLMTAFDGTSEDRRHGGMTLYGNLDPKEAHAEAFAEWAGRGGRELGPWFAYGVKPVEAVVSVYADIFGWGSGLAEVTPDEEALAAAGPLDDFPLVLADGPSGPIYVYADGRIERPSLVASAAEFANPWHDEVGKFAEKGTGSRGKGRVSKAEEAAAAKLARDKAKNVPKPTDDDVIQGQVDALLAREGLVRAGGDRRGNNTARKKRAKALAAEFGDGTTCPCVDCGQTLAADPATADRLGIDALTQDKILVGTLGGSYKLDNLIPSCPPCNQSRGDREGVGVVGDVKQSWGNAERFTRQVVRENGEAIASRFQARRTAILKRKGTTWEEHVAAEPDALPQDFDRLRRPVGGNFVAALVERFDGVGVNGDSVHHELGVGDPVRVDVPRQQLPFDGGVVHGVVEVVGGVPTKPFGSHHRAVLDNHSPQRSQFGNPWHDEVGRFAPKGTGSKVMEGWEPYTGVESDRPVFLDESLGTPVYAVQAANGQMIEMKYHTSVAEERISDPELRQRGIHMLNGVADAYDMAPLSTGIIPIVKVVSDSRIPAPAAVDPNGTHYSQNTILLNDIEEGTTGRHMWEQMDNPSPEIAKHLETFMMPASREVAIPRYVGAHEYGHVRAAYNIDDRAVIAEVQPMTLGQNRDERTEGVWPYMSTYARKNAVEAHAEAFAEWAMSGGETTNRFARAYADIFGWGEEEQALAASAGSEFPDWDDIVFICDSPIDGPSYVTETGTIVAAGNPWHDEIGQFAPKGTGTNWGTIAGRADQAEAAGSRVSELDLEQAGILNDRLTKFAAAMGTDFENDDGVILTKFALGQRHGRGTMRGFAATDPDGVVLGAIAYNTIPLGSSEEYHVEFVGSTGLIKGVGTQLVIPMMEQAARDGARVTLKIARTMSAPAFWDSLGFERDRNDATSATMRPAEVQAWVDNVAREREGVLVAAGAPAEEGWDPDDDRWAAHAIELGLMNPPTIVASAAQFRNPWHDEIGRFAPKGTGTKFDTVTDDFAEAPPGYIPEAREEWRAGYAYLTENEMPEWWMGTEFMDADGLPKRENEVAHDWDREGISEEFDAWKAEVGETVTSGVWMIGREAERARKRAIQLAISTNQIDLAAAEERWGKYDSKPDRGEWEDLPPVLYHATSALGAITESGRLLTRDEIGGSKNAAGLGGGTSDTISFTSDKAVADGIVRSLHEVRRAITTDNDSLRSELEERAGSWWPEVVRSFKSQTGKPDGQPQSLEDRYNLYRVYSAYREQNTGVLDPLFFGVDPERLAAIDPDNIGVVTVQPAMPGARGYRVSALGEWRTPTGEATQILNTERSDDLGGFATLRPFTTTAREVVEFANPWHDEIGRFAPKGTGRRVIDMTGRSTENRGRTGEANEPTATLPSAPLTSAEMEAIDSYRGYGHIVNGHLRKPPLEADMKPIVKGLDSAFAHSPGFTEDTVVWRLIPASLNQHPDGPGWGDPSPFVDQGYTSTTLDRRQLNLISDLLGYGQTHVEVQVVIPKGTPGLRVSGASFQDEILLPRGGRMVPTGLDEWRFETTEEPVSALAASITLAIESPPEVDEQYGDLRRFVFDADDVELVREHVQASAREVMEFANPWHDEIGRFAPKGTGTRGPVDAEAADEAFEEEYGNERPSGDGDCYPVALRFLSGIPRGEEDRYKLVHGVPEGRGPIEGVRFGHAWIERTDPLPDTLPPEQREMFERYGMNVTVIDKSNGNDVEMPRMMYYQLGNINPADVRRYTPDEARREAVRTRHYGPWT